MFGKILILLLISPIFVFSSPWIVYGATTIAAGGVIDNPEPNSNGVVGEVTSLPHAPNRGHPYPDLMINIVVSDTKIV